MATLFNRSNMGAFQKDSSIYSIFHGSNAFLLEDELNEAQWNSIERLATQIREQYSSGLLKPMTINASGLTNFFYVSSQDSKPLSLYVDGYLLKVGNNNPGSLPGGLVPSDDKLIIKLNPAGASARTDLVMLEAWFEVMSYADTITKFGGDTTPTITVNIKDSRTNIETSRRVQFRWRLRTIDNETLITNVNAMQYDGTTSNVKYSTFDKIYIADTGLKTVGVDIKAPGIVYGIPLLTVSRPANNSAISASNVTNIAAKSNVVQLGSPGNLVTNAKDSFVDAINEIAKSVSSYIWTATEGQSTFTLPAGQSYNANTNSIEIYVFGVKQVSGVHFLETNNTSFMLSEGLPVGTIVEAKWYKGSVAAVLGHASTHQLGGPDELSVNNLKNYTELVKNKFDERGLNVKDFGAKGDGVTDDSTAIQAAEDAAAINGGGLLFPPGTYAVGKSINKKSHVHWIGVGKPIVKRINNLSPLGSVFSIVFADSAFNWSISGMEFQNIDHGTLLLGIGASTLTQAAGMAPGKTSSCIDAYRSGQWYIENCVFKKFSQGIMYRGCTNFRIVKNSFYSDNGKTVNSILAGTYTNFTSYTYTGAIVFGYIPSGPEPQRAEDFIISQNYISVPGLDLGIDGLAQTFDTNPGLIQGNIITGANCGIQIYRGSFTAPNDTSTFRGDLLVQGNRITATYEQGIYIRSTFGVKVDGNFLDRVGVRGNNGAGSSCGAIITRVNPYLNGYDKFPLSSPDLGVTISNNMIVNPGNANSVDNDATIQARVPHVRIVNNEIVREKPVYTTTFEGTAILIDNAEKILSAEVSGNRIHNFRQGISWSGGGYYVDVNDETIVGKIINNIVEDCYTGIKLDSYRIGIHIDNNIINRTGDRAIYVRNTPFATIERNKINVCSAGVSIGAGTLASDYSAIKSKGVFTGSVGRAGGTLIVRNNIINKATTSHDIQETGGGDNSFHGRCMIWEGDIVDTVIVRSNDFANATPPSTWTARTWNPGDIVYNTVLDSAVSQKKICIVGGTYGSTVFNSTGNIISGTRVITGVSDLSSIGKSMYITINGENKKIKDVDYVNKTITVDSVFSSTASAAAIGNSVPVFIDTTSGTPVVTSLPTPSVAYRGRNVMLQGAVGVKEVTFLNVTSGATAAGNVTLTLDGVPFTIALAINDNTSNLVAAKIAAVTFPNWTVSLSNSTVTFTHKNPGSRMDPTYSAGSTGAAGTTSVQTQGVTGTADAVFTCKKLANESYDWIQIG